MAERKVRSVSIRRAEGGFTMDVEREPEKTKGKDTCCWEPSVPYVFTDIGALFASLRQHLTGSEKEAMEEKSGSHVNGALPMMFSQKKK